MLHIVKKWFTSAVPNPTDKNLQVQIGVHIEEFAEMLETFTGNDKHSQKIIQNLFDAAKLAAKEFKTGSAGCFINDRKACLDSLGDQIVTAVGIGHMAKLNVPVGLERINTSNWSKFTENGEPIFDENGKIKKGSRYQKPDLEGLY